MCGISGIYSKDLDLKKILKEFNISLQNRGPDYASYFINKDNNFGMSHTRLSILDLSEKGNQPMQDSSGDWVISYNGEIYNHLEIRDIISKKYNNPNLIWKSSSDTETILASNNIFGFERTLEMLEGMFAFALYNKKKNILYIVRDRIGEKPIYYYHKNNVFVFGSDLSIFKKVKNIKFEIDEKILPEYLQNGCIKAPNSIFKYIKKLEPGSYLKLNDNFSQIKTNFYWSIENVVNSTYSLRNNHNKNFLDEKENLKKLLEKTVEKQTISDVGVGSFLSGGVDSSLISSILSKYSKKKIKTFTVAFENRNYDESEQAKKISNYLKTDHYEYYMSKNDLISAADNLHLIYSEPFADSSQLPTYLISKLMKKETKVILSGDGGDELFGGYNRYIYLQKIKSYSKNLPGYLKRNLNLIIKFLPISLFDKYFSFFGIRNFKIKMKKLIEFINVQNDTELYRKMTSINHNPEYFLNNTVSNNKKNFNYNDLPTFKSEEEKFMFLDQKDYLPNDILCKVDRATMFNSIESRAPILDRNIIEYSWKIPLQFKIKNNTGKFIIREILKDYLPKNLISTEKSGFGIPIDNLLRSDLKDWAHDTIMSSDNFSNIINVKNLKNTWEQHLSNKVNAGEKLWPLLVLNNWLTNQ